MSHPQCVSPKSTSLPVDILSVDGVCERFESRAHLPYIARHLLGTSFWVLKSFRDAENTPRLQAHYMILEGGDVLDPNQVPHVWALPVYRSWREAFAQRLEGYRCEPVPKTGKKNRFGKHKRKGPGRRSWLVMHERMIEAGCPMRGNKPKGKDWRKSSWRAHGEEGWKRHRDHQWKAKT